MSESENALPLNEEFWEHVDHLDFKVVLPVSKTRAVNVLNALQDIHNHITKDPEGAKFMITGLAAIIVASKYDKADEVYTEVMVQSAKHDMDKELEKLLSEQ